MQHKNISNKHNIFICHTVYQNNLVLDSETTRINMTQSSFANANFHHNCRVLCPEGKTGYPVNKDCVCYYKRL